jgi:hypothetical protein
MGSTIYLLQLTVYDPALLATRTLYFSSTAGYNDPSAPAYHEPRIESVVLFETMLSADPRRAAPQIAAGGVKLKNHDEQLTATFLQCGVAGFAARLLVGEIDDKGLGDYSGFVEVLSGKAVEPTLDGTSISVNVRDRTLDLEVPVARTAFAGTNSGGAGVESLPNEAAGQYKPAAWGRVRFVPVPCCNSTRAVDQLHDGQINQILAAYDKGVALSAGAARTFANIDNTTDPAVGVFDWHLGSGSSGAYARRRSTAVSAGPFCYDYEADARGGTWRSTSADIAAELVAQRVTGGPAVIDGDRLALNVAAAGVVGFFNRDGLKVSDAVSQILQSVGAKWWLDGAGFRMAQLTAPSGSPVVNFRRLTLDDARAATDADVVSFKILPPDMPIVWRVVVRYRRYWSTQTDGLDANVAQSVRAELQSEYRSTTPASDASVLAQYPAAVELTLDTLLDNVSDANALRDALLSMFKVRRDTLRIEAQIDAGLAQQIALLGVVRVFDILDYGVGGRLMRVLGRSAYNHLNGRISLKVWG